MTIPGIRTVLLFLLMCIAVGCANVVPPAGGKKDVTPPKLLAVTPHDSLLNARITRIEMRFNEFVNVNNPAAEVQVSPLLPVPLTVIALRHSVITRIPDSLLRDSTTYRISFGNAIGDLHENNIFSGYTYTFSTGSYFDSLRLDGYVLNAATGLPDTGAFVTLYSAAKNDSAVVREKPMYVTRVQSGGIFSFKGLPNKAFRIYALKDANNNLIYDGGQEAIAFNDALVVPADTVIPALTLRLFTEPVTDTVRSDSSKSVSDRAVNKESRNNKTGELLYNVGVDTSDIRKRTFDIMRPLYVSFNRPIDSIRKQRVNLAYDSVGISVESDFDFRIDSVKKNTLLINTNWKENTVYTLRLLKNFARDTTGAGAMPSRYTFKTKSDDDYGKLNVHLPSRYKDSLYVLMISNETDTVYQKPVSDTIVHLVKLRPANYTVRIIVDKNHNGKWDTGNLFEKLQPEEVMPHTNTIQLKPGWENTVDFVPVTRPSLGKSTDSPKKRDKP